MNLGEAGESNITFDNLDENVDDSPYETMDDGEESDVPEIDLDKQEDVGSTIADEKSDSKQKESKEPKPQQEEKQQDQESLQEAIEEILEFGDEKYDLLDLIENPEARAKFQDLIRNGAMMRADYSKKTAAHAEAVKNWEQAKQADIASFQNYLSETNRAFNESPLAFVRRAFSKNANGETLPPQVQEELINKWANKFAEQLEKGSDYDPEAEMKYYEIEKRLNAMEREKMTEAQRKQQEREEQEVSELSDLLLKSATNSMPKDDVFLEFVNGIPGLKEKLLEGVIMQVDKDRNARYDENDPSWNDKDFLMNYSFDKLWENQVNLFKKAYDRSYEKYVESKRSAGKRRPMKSSAANANSGSAVDKPTFASFGLFD